MMLYGGSAAPAGWLLCQGQSLVRTDYGRLFGVIGTTFGTVDGAHFTLPDLRDKFPKGANADLGTAVAAAGHQHTVTALTIGGGTAISLAAITLPSHTHGLNSHTHALAGTGASVNWNSTASVSQRLRTGTGFTPDVKFTTSGDTASSTAQANGVTVQGNTGAAAGSTAGPDSFPAVGGSATTPAVAAGGIGGSVDSFTAPNPSNLAVNYIIKF
jgi:microcystin-dependent protein